MKVHLTNSYDHPKNKRDLNFTTGHKIPVGETLTVAANTYKNILDSNAWLLALISQGKVQVVEEQESDLLDAQPLELTRTSIAQMGHDDLDELLEAHGIDAGSGYSLGKKRKILAKVVFVDDMSDG